MAFETEYRPLMADAALEDEEEGIRVKLELESQSSEARDPVWWKLKPTYRVLVGIVALQAILLCITVSALYMRKGSCTKHHSQPLGATLYSPALEVVEPEVRVFSLGFPGDMSSFQVPSSPELDNAWEDLYGFGISRVTKDQASQLPNKTHAIPGDESHYIAELDVFHNLHCLNMVRKALDPEYYPDWNITNSTTAAQHVSHCVDWIRQSIMCHADTSVIVWQWAESLNKSIVRGDIAHTCRDFTKVHSWAKERVLLDDYDPTVRILDDISIPVYHVDHFQRN